MHDEEEEFDLDLECPACGCEEIEILRFPVAGTWAGSGKGECCNCGHVMRLGIEHTDEDDSPYANDPENPDKSQSWPANWWPT